MVLYGHFQTINLTPLSQTGTPRAQSEAFCWASLFLQVSRAIGYKEGGKIEKKARKMIFRALTVTSRCKKIDLKALFQCTMDLWWGTGICEFVSECLFVLSKQLGGSKVTSTKKWHFPPDIHKVNEALDGGAWCHP